MSVEIEYQQDHVTDCSNTVRYYVREMEKGFSVIDAAFSQGRLKPPCVIAGPFKTKKAAKESSDSLNGSRKRTEVVKWLVSFLETDKFLAGSASAWMRHQVPEAIEFSSEQDADVYARTTKMLQQQQGKSGVVYVTKQASIW